MYARNDLSQLRYQQIVQLQQLIPEARCTDGRNQNLWDIPVTTVFGSLTYRVELPQGFPERPPELRLLVQATHPWVNQQLKIIGHPNLSRWSIRDNLGRICQEVSAKFKEIPPVPSANPIIPSPQPQQSAIRSASPQPFMIQQQQQQQQSQLNQQQVLQQQQQQRPKPALERQVSSEIPQRFDILDRFNNDELNNILNDESKFEEIFYSLDVVKNVNVLCDEMYDQVEEIAKSNLQYQNTIENHTNELAILRDEIAAKQLHLRDLQTRQKSIAKRFSVENLCKLLNDQSNEIDDESDTYKREFFDGDININDFIKKYKALRIKYHHSSACNEILMKN